MEPPKVKIQIETKTVRGEELLPGDLFSTAGPEHWANVNVAGEGDIGPIGEKVYIRTNSPVQEDDGNEEVTLVTLSYVREDGRVRPSRAHESYHIDVGWDDDGNRIAEVSPNPNCPYCRGETVEEVPMWDGRGAHAYKPSVADGLTEASHCYYCGMSDREGNHKVQPIQVSDTDEGKATDATIY